MAAVAVIPGFHAIGAGQGAGDGEDFGAVALGEVAAEIAATATAAMAVIDFFTARVDHVQVDIGIVGIPGQDHAQADFHRCQQFGGNLKGCDINFGMSGQQCGQFVQGDQVDFGKTRGPGAGGDLPEQAGRALHGRSIQTCQCQCQIAVALGLFRALGQGIFERAHGQFGMIPLHQAIAQDTDHGGVFIADFSEVGEDA